MRDNLSSILLAIAVSLSAPAGGQGMNSTPAAAKAAMASHAPAIVRH